MYTLAKPIAVSRPTTTRLASSRFLRLMRSRADLLLVAAHRGERGRLAAQAVVEQLLPLGSAELHVLQRAHVDRAVEVEVARDVPGDALIDGDVAVRLR